MFLVFQERKKLSRMRIICRLQFTFFLFFILFSLQAICQALNYKTLDYISICTPPSLLLATKKPKIKKRINTNLFIGSSNSIFHISSLSWTFSENAGLIFVFFQTALKRGFRISIQLQSSFNEVRFFGRHWSKTQPKLWKWKFSWKKTHL